MLNRDAPKRRARCFGAIDCRQPAAHQVYFPSNTLINSANQVVNVGPGRANPAMPCVLRCFVYTFPRLGRYQLWGQFKHAGEIVTVPLTVDVVPRTSAFRVASYLFRGQEDAWHYSD